MATDTTASAPVPAPRVLVWQGARARGAAGILALALVLATFVVLGSLWAVCVPAFEKPDEVNHLAHVQLVGREWRLPVQAKETGAYIDVELQQPPLYYVGAALVARLGVALGIPLVDLEAWGQRGNPRFMGGALHAGRQPNFMTHEAGEWPPAGLLLLRGLSLGLAFATLVVTFGLARRAFGRRTGAAAFATALVAFVPQVTFIATSVTNDVLAWLMGALMLAALVRLRTSPPAAAQRRWLELGVVCGLGLLTKLTLLAVLPLAFLALPRGASARENLRGLATWLVTAGLISGWWFARNLVLYDTLLGSQEVVSPEAYAWNIHPKTLADPFFRGPFWASVWESFVANLGFVNVRVHHLIHLAATELAVLALVGLTLAVWRFARRPSEASRDALWSTTFYGAAIVLAVAALIVYNLTVTQSQGRYLFYVLPAWAILGTIGLDTIAAQITSEVHPDVAARTVRALVLLTLGLAIAVNLYALFRVVVPTYGAIGCAAA